MGILKKIQNIFKRSDEGQPIGYGPRYGSYYSLPIGGNPMTVSTVYRCVDLLSSKVASLPMMYQRLKGSVFVDDMSTDIPYLLRVQPNPYMTAFDFWKLLVTHVLLNGNAYVFPKTDANTMSVSQFFLLDPNSVEHDTSADIYIVNDAISGIKGKFTEDQIIHIKNLSRDGKTGLSTIAHARMTTSIAMTSDKETLNRYANGGGIKGFITNDTTTSASGYGEYADEELDKLSEDIEGKFREGRQVVAIHGVAKFQPTTMSASDMQFLESKKLNVIEICRWFGVSPALCYAEGSNYKTAELADAELLANTLGPLLTRIEVEFLRKLEPKSLAFKRRYWFDRRLLYACDLITKVDYQTKTIAAGIYTPNEWREFENKERVEGGDTILVSTNLTTIDNLKSKSNGEESGNKEGVQS